MKTQPVIVVITAFSALGLLVGLDGCTTKHVAGTPVDEEDEGGTVTPTTDSGKPVTTTDSGVITDTGVATDTGVITDTGPPVEAGACLGTTASADAGGACVGGACSAVCGRFNVNYKAGVAEEANKCLTLAICGGAASGIAACADKAIAKACADATATTFCTPNFNGCKASNPADTITLAGCVALATALNTTGRAAFQTCMENDPDCGGCIPQMKPPP